MQPHKCELIWCCNNVEAVIVLGMEPDIPINMWVCRTHYAFFYIALHPAFDAEIVH